MKMHVVQQNRYTAWPVTQWRATQQRAREATGTGNHRMNLKNTVKRWKLDTDKCMIPFI